MSDDTKLSKKECAWRATKKWREAHSDAYKAICKRWRDTHQAELAARMAEIADIVSANGITITDGAGNITAPGGIVDVGAYEKYYVPGGVLVARA